MGHFLTKTQILSIYDAYKSGKRQANIARDMGLDDSTVYSCVGKLKKYLLNGIPHSYNTSYTKAIKEITKSEEKVSEPQPQEAQTTNEETDPYNKLNTAFEQFTASIGEFVDALLEKKMKYTMQELEKQREANKILLDTIEQAKTSNWINNLKRKFA